MKEGRRPAAAHVAGVGPRGDTGGVPPVTVCGGRPRGPRGDTGGVPPVTVCGGHPRGPRGLSVYRFFTMPCDNPGLATTNVVHICQPRANIDDTK